MRFKKGHNSSYVGDLFERPDKVIKRLVKIINTYFPYCEGVVSTSGISGASVLIPVASELKLPFGFVRDKASHAGKGRFEGHHRCRNVVIIDDFIDTGTTVKRAIRVLKKEDIEVVGIALYGGRKLNENIRRDVFNAGFNVKIGADKQKFLPVVSIECSKPYARYCESMAKEQYPKEFEMFFEK